MGGSQNKKSELPGMAIQLMLPYWRSKMKSDENSTSNIQLPLPDIGVAALQRPLAVKDLAAWDTPGYRIIKNPLSVSLTELLASIIGGKDQLDIAGSVLKKINGDPKRLVTIDISELLAIRGIGMQAASKLKACAVLANRIVTTIPEERPTINSPADAAALVQYEMCALEQEHLRVLLLDTRNHVLDIVEVYRGSVNSSQVRVGEIFKAAVRRNSTAVIVVHNHPSGDPTPSPDDVAVTRAFVQAGKLLDCEVLDHLVIGQGRWVSLKERGLGFT